MSLPACSLTLVWTYPSQVDEALAELPEKQLKMIVMPFAKFKIEEVAKGGAQARSGSGLDPRIQGRAGTQRRAV